jgi:hypothetical protein
MTQTGQTDDKKEVAKLRKALEKIRPDLAEKDKLLHLAHQRIEHLTEQNTKLQEKECLLEERFAELREKNRLLDLASQEAKHFQESSFKAAVIQHGLGILTAVSLGVGFNFATSPLTTTPGIILIFIGIGTESISFYVTYSGVRKNHK